MSATAALSKSRNLHAPHTNLAVRLGILFIIFFAVIFISSPFTRGSDQYWYVGDVERAVLQDGLLKSNSVFPASIPNNVSELPRPWVQNKPVSYIVLAITYLTRNGHFAWLILNSICLFGSALLIASSLKIRNSNKLLFVALFMFFPLNFYLATQALPEIFLMLLISAIHFIILRMDTGLISGLLLGIIGGVLISQRPNYLLLIPLIPLVLFVIHKRRAFFASAVFVITALLVTYAGSLIFQEHLIRIPSLMDTVLNNIPGKTNMGNFLYNYDNSNLGVMEIAGMLVAKFIGALKIQFEFSGMSSIMFGLINLMLVSIPVLLYKKMIRRLEFFVSLMFAIIHFITIILFYNQYRYAAAIVPSLFILNVLMVKTLKFDLKRFHVPVVVLSGFFLLSTVIGYQVRKGAVAENKMINEIKQTAREFNVGSILCEWNGGGCLSVGYAVSPKIVFYFPKDYTKDEWLATAGKMKATHGIVYSESELYRNLKQYIKKERNIEGSDIIFFEMVHPEAKSVKTALIK